MPGSAGNIFRFPKQQSPQAEPAAHYIQIKKTGSERCCAVFLNEPGFAARGTGRSALRFRQITAGFGHQGIVGVVDDKSGGCACHFFDVFALNVVDLHLLVCLLYTSDAADE